MKKWDSHIQNNETVLYHTQKSAQMYYRPETTKLLRETTYGKLFETGLGDDFSDLKSTLIIPLAPIDSFTETILALFSVPCCHFHDLGNSSLSSLPT